MVRRTSFIVFVLFVVLALFVEVNSADQTKILTGNASWYSRNDKTDPFEHIQNADGSRFDERALTCAMRSRGFGKMYRVTNTSNHKSVIVRHSDFGPSLKYKGRRLNRVIDLSKKAFSEIADLKIGVITVYVEAL